MRNATSRRRFAGTGRALIVYNVAAYGFLLAPILVVIALSFTSGNSLTFPPPGLSLRWFRYLAGRDEFLSAALARRWPRWRRWRQRRWRCRRQSR